MRGYDVRVVWHHSLSLFYLLSHYCHAMAHSGTGSAEHNGPSWDRPHVTHKDLSKVMGLQKVDLLRENEKNEDTWKPFDGGSRGVIGDSTRSQASDVDYFSVQLCRLSVMVLLGMISRSLAGEISWKGYHFQ